MKYAILLQDCGYLAARLNVMFFMFFLILLLNLYHDVNYIDRHTKMLANGTEHMFCVESKMHALETVLKLISGSDDDVDNDTYREAAILAYDLLKELKPFFIAQGKTG